jgi:UDP-GlcNAc:undecaprenyl-phosphate GlcNAc-1-phosphate transferase
LPERLALPRQASRVREVVLDFWELIVPFAAACGVAAVSTPMVSLLARQVGAVDRPNERKVSRRADMPLLGGIAVALGCSVGLASSVISAPWDADAISRIEGFLIGGSVLLVVGVFDDRWDVSAWSKIVFQVAAAAVAIEYGYVIVEFREPFSRVAFELPFWFGALVTTLWIVAVSNAMNLIDGLDGLSAGIGAIIAATLAVICAQADQPVGVLLGVTLVGALLGFLPFNFPPARIFLGDTGALFIGFSLSLVALEGYIGGYRKASLMTFLVPLLALAVPLLDTVLSIWRRIRAGQPIFNADRQHMHHRLLEAEGSDRRAVLALYFLTGCFCVIAVSFTKLQGYAALIFLAAVVALTVRLLRNMGVYEVGGAAGQQHRAGDSR